MSNSSNFTSYTKKAINAVKSIIPTITKEEENLLTKIYDFITKPQRISNGYLTEEDKTLFIQECNINKNNVNLTNLAHYLVLLPLPKFKRSDLEERNKQAFKSIIKDIIEMLLEKKLIDPNHTLDDRKNFIGTMYSYYNKKNYPLYGDYDVKLMELAIKNGLNVNHKDANGNTILNIAITNPEIRHKDMYGEHLVKIVECVAESYDFYANNNKGLSFIEILNDRQQKDPIKIKEETIPFSHGKENDESYYYWDILNIIKSKYGENTAICILGKKELEDRLLSLFNKINRFRVFLNGKSKQPIYDKEDTRLLRITIDKREREYSELIKDTKSYLSLNLGNNFIINEIIKFIEEGKITPTIIRIFNIINFDPSFEISRAKLIDASDRTSFAQEVSLSFIRKFGHTLAQALANIPLSKPQPPKKPKIKVRVKPKEPSPKA